MTVSPTLETDAAPPERGCKGIVFLAGAIKFWWLTKCDRRGCGHINVEGAKLCTRKYVSAQTGKWEMCAWPKVSELWGGPEHLEYVEWRKDVRRGLINAGYLTYAPHEAFKGVWDARAQAVNDAGIAASDAMVVLSPLTYNGIFIPTHGTDNETTYAVRIGTPVILAPPGSGFDRLLNSIQEVMNVG